MTDELCEDVHAIHPCIQLPGRGAQVLQYARNGYLVVLANQDIPVVQHRDRLLPRSA